MNRIIRTLALGTAVGLVFGGVGTCGAIEESATRAMSDQVINAHREAQILVKFSNTPELRAYDLIVLVDGDKAALGGAVDSDAAGKLAERIAFAAEGILRVENKIRIDPDAVPKHHGAADRSADMIAADAAISASVKSRLQWNVHTEDLDARIDTREGAVTLDGSTISYAERDMAETIARNTVGVVTVNNALVLSHEPRPVAWRDRDGDRDGKPPSDTWITSKVKSSLQFTRGMRRFDIGVTTSNGVVSLSGVVDSEAVRELAMQVAQDIHGVRQVDAGGLTVG